jgi:vancomycin resistance protein YoaR
MSTEFPAASLLGVGVLTGLGALMVYVWNMSKQYTTMKLNIVNQEKKHVEDITVLRAQIAETRKDLELKVSEAKVERREEISRAVENQTGKFIEQREQLTGIRSEVKDANTRVTVVSTKVDATEKEQANLHLKIDQNITFLTNWLNRVEDRIKDAERKATNDVECARRELFDCMNMLANLAKRQTRG